MELCLLMKGEDVLRLCGAGDVTRVCSSTFPLSPQEPYFPELVEKIQSAIASLGGCVVPKLNWSTPRVSAYDGHVIIDAHHVMTCDVT